MSPIWRKLISWTRRHPWRAATLTLLFCFLLVNLLGYQHARAMLTFTADTVRTPSPQSLSFGEKLEVLLCGVRNPRPVNSRSPEDLQLPFKTLHIATDDGVSLEGWLVAPPTPRGTVLLFHGYAASRSSLLEQARAFHEMGFATVLMDFRGSGGSDGNCTTLGYHEAQDVAAAVRHVHTLGLPRPVVLYGQSMGGAAILRAIAALDVHADAIIVESVFDRMLGAVRNRFELMGISSFPAAELLVFWGGVHVGFSGFEHNLVDYARACNCPALVLHGTNDQHAKLEEGHAIYENLAGSKDLVEFPGAGHTSLLAADPARWTESVSHFLAKQLKRAAAN